MAYRVDRRLTTERAKSSQLAECLSASIAHRHVLTPREARRDSSGDLWLITPFVGSARGLLTLSQLASARDGGTLTQPEVIFAGLQLLSASAHAHATGIAHGPIDADHVLVDPHGSLLVELYGVEQRLRDCPVPTDADRALETRSIATLMGRLATWHQAPDSGARPELSTVLRAWITRAESETGFVSPQEAHTELQSVLRTFRSRRVANKMWLRDLRGLVTWALARR